MTNDEARARNVTMRPSYQAILWVGLLAISAGTAHCGSSSSTPIERVDSGSTVEAGRNIDAGHHAPGRDAAAAPENASGSGTSVGATAEDGGDGLPGSGGEGDETCVPDYQPCFDGGLACCGPSCTSGYCGSCGAEGVDCTASPICCLGLKCMPFGDAGRSYCGTNLCVPNGSACGGDSNATCCDDNCVDGFCTSDGS
jgi:hypothetical protein